MGKIANFFREQKIVLAGQQRAQMLALDAEFEQMETKLKVLEAENLKLQAKANPQEREIERLKQQINKSAAPVEQAPLHEDAQKMLRLIASKQYWHSKDDVFRQMQASVQLNPVWAAYHFDELQRRDFVHAEPPIGFYTATPAGRKYLVENDLI